MAAQTSSGLSVRITSCPAGPLLPNVSSTFLSPPFQATTWTRVRGVELLVLADVVVELQVDLRVDLQVLQVRDQVLDRLLVRAAP